MKIPFVGPSYEMDARSFGVQRSINLFPIVAEVEGTKSVSSLRGTPGYINFATAGGGPIRNGIASTSGRCFVVSGEDFIEINTDGTTTSHSAKLNSQVNRVSISENNSKQIIVVDGTEGWIFAQDTNTWTQITDGDFPGGAIVSYQDGYFLITKPNTQQFYISAIEDGFSWGALDFTSVESSPDNLVCVMSDNGNVWLFGNRSVEVYQNTGNAAFPFERIPGAILQTGCVNGFTVAKFDNSVCWLGTDEQGDSVVWIADGYQAKRISTMAIEKRINEVDNFTDAYAWSYHEQGHIFYCLQLKGLDTTLVFDGSTNQWHERMFKNTVTNKMELHRASCFMFFNGKGLIGDRESGEIYELSLSYESDNGDAQIRERICPHIQAEKKMLTYASFELDMEVGVGLVTGQGSNPKIMLQYSNDGGKTYGSELWRDMGKIGEYGTRVVWRQLGQARDRVFKVRISDPVFVEINEAYLNNT